MWNKIASTQWQQGPHPSSPNSCKNGLANHFTDEWNRRRQVQSKLRFYNTIKTEFGYEPYLNINDANARKELSRIRTSAHDLRLETGRYSKANKSSESDRACRFCCTPAESDILQLLESLPMFEPAFFIESEEHAMTECPGYHHLRTNLSDALKCHLLLQQYAFIMYDATLAKELGLFLKNSFNLRNPKKRIK